MRSEERPQPKVQRARLTVIVPFFIIFFTCLFYRKSTHDQARDDVEASEQDGEDEDPSLSRGGKRGHGVKKGPP